MNRTLKKLVVIGLCLIAGVIVIKGSNAEAPTLPEDKIEWEEPVIEYDPVPPKEITISPSPVPVASEEVEVIEPLDRTKPIYEVYKNGYYVAAATPEIQWIIRDMVEAYDLPEDVIYGLICGESTFVPYLESFDGGCWGLAQINTFWITRANIPHFTEDYRNRNLCDPYDNLLTLAEMMCYARDTYSLDYTQRADKIKYLYWHNTGLDPTRVTRWDYATRALGYAAELVTLQSL